MDSGRWPDQGRSGERFGRRWRGEPTEVASPERPADWLRPAEDDVGRGPADYPVDDLSSHRLLSGPLAEYYNRPGWADDAAAPAANGVNGLSPPTPHADPEPAHRGASGHARGWAPEERDEGSGLVRPYFRTKGRTRPSQDLAIEALVSTSERGRLLDQVRVPEHRSICDICLDTRSVAEVAAYLKLPLGVVRVLVGDVAGLGLVLIHSADSAVGDRPSIEFMERVLSGLRRI